jgi:predicted membrane protein
MFLRFLAVLPFIGILLGMPFVLAWIVLWVILISVIMAVIYRLDPTNRQTAVDTEEARS